MYEYNVSTCECVRPSPCYPVSVVGSALCSRPSPSTCASPSPSPSPYPYPSPRLCLASLSPAHASLSAVRDGRGEMESDTDGDGCVRFGLQSERGGEGRMRGVERVESESSARRAARSLRSRAREHWYALSTRVCSLRLGVQLPRDSARCTLRLLRVDTSLARARCRFLFVRSTNTNMNTRRRASSRLHLS